MVLVSIDLPSPELQHNKFSPVHANLMPNDDSGL